MKRAGAGHGAGLRLAGYQGRRVGAAAGLISAAAWHAIRPDPH